MDWIEKLDEESFWHPAEGEARSRELLSSRLHGLSRGDQSRLLAYAGSAALRMRKIEPADWAISSGAERAGGDSDAISLCCARLSSVRKRQGRLEEARRCAEEAVTYALSPSVSAEAFLHRASIKLYQNQAQRGLIDALGALERLTPERGSQLVSAVSMVAASLQWLERPQEALPWLEQAEELTAAGEDGLKARTSWIWAGIYLGMGEQVKAEQLYQGSLRWFATNGYPWEAAQAAIELASLLLERDRLGEAYELAKFSFPILSVIRAEEDAYSAFLVLFKSIEAGTLKLQDVERARTAIQEGRLKPVASCRFPSFRS